MTPQELVAGRETLGLSQAGLGAALGISQASICQMETGKRAITRRTAMQVKALLAQKSEDKQ